MLFFSARPLLVALVIRPEHDFSYANVKFYLNFDLIFFCLMSKGDDAVVTFRHQTKAFAAKAAFIGNMVVLLMTLLISRRAS